MKSSAFRFGWLMVLLLAVTSSAQGQYMSMKTQDSLVQVLVKRHMTLASARQSMPGYRIQIFFGSQRTEANDLRTDFLKSYPDVGAYILYQQPNFKIRVGDFRTRLEAMKFLNELHARYSTAFIVRDDVKLPVLP